MNCKIFSDDKNNKYLESILIEYNIGIYDYIDLEKESVKLDSSGVYIFMDSFKQPAYIGQSEKLKDRVHKRHEKYEPGLMVIIIPCQDEQIALDIEGILIIQMKPYKNQIRWNKGIRRKYNA